MHTVERQPTESRQLTSFLDGRIVRSEMGFQKLRSQLAPDNTQLVQQLIRRLDS